MRTASTGAAQLLSLGMQSAERGPAVPFRWLDALWIQVTGTLCNIACRHCFISCGPRADQIPMMSVDEVRRALNEGAAAGMREVYFTGASPSSTPTSASSWTSHSRRPRSPS